MDVYYSLNRKAKKRKKKQKQKNVCKSQWARPNGGLNCALLLGLM